MDAKQSDTPSNILLDAVKALPTQSTIWPLPSEQVSEERLSHLEITLRKRIDALILDWLLEKGWPSLSPKEAFFLRYRLEWARHALNFLYHAPVIYNGETDEVMEWLLISSWRKLGLPVWKEEMKAIIAAYEQGQSDKSQNSFAA
jgi:hypothetical protein